MIPQREKKSEASRPSAAAVFRKKDSWGTALRMCAEQPPYLVCDLPACVLRELVDLYL
jgi:hypothetical protein